MAVQMTKSIEQRKIEIFPTITERVTQHSQQTTRAEEPKQNQGQTKKV